MTAVPMASDYENHVMGDSWLRYSEVDQCSYVYVNIPKNASCWFKYHFNYSIKYNYLDHSYHPAPGSIVTPEQVLQYEKSRRFVVALRNPLERWISGFAQYSLGWPPDHPNFIKNVRFKDALNQMVFDIHTRPQVDFIKDISHDQIVWFHCNEFLEKNFTHFMTSKFNGVDVLPVDQDVDNIFNVTSKVPARDFTWKDYHPGGGFTVHTTPGMSQQEIVNYIKKIIDKNPKYLRQIVSFYEDDYRLIDQANFYRAYDIW